LEGAITSANHTPVKDGWYWWYRKYTPGDMVLERLEAEAREAKRGLWADPLPVPPWEWRKINKFGVNRYDPRNPVPPKQYWDLYSYALFWGRSRVKMLQTA
jgi:hypothetical protein